MLSPNEALLETFVDDPCFTLTNTEACNKATLATVVAIWRCLGFPLAFRKGQLSQNITWIGATLELKGTTVTASIKQSILEDLQRQVKRALKTNLLSNREVQSLAGRANHVATLIPFWRPLLQSFWKSLSVDTLKHHRNCVWTKPLRPSLIWISKFLDRPAGTISRSFSLSSRTSVSTNTSSSSRTPVLGDWAQFCSSTADPTNTLPTPSQTKMHAGLGTLLANLPGSRYGKHYAC
jgi:hypothetical protein